MAHNRVTYVSRALRLTQPPSRRPRHRHPIFAASATAAAEDRHGKYPPAVSSGVVGEEAKIHIKVCPREITRVFHLRFALRDIRGWQAGVESRFIPRTRHAAHGPTALEFRGFDGGLRGFVCSRDRFAVIAR